MSQNLGRIAPDASVNRAGAMLAAGQLTITLTSKVTGEHITIKAVCKARNAETNRWERVPFEQATHVFCEVPSSSWGDRVGTFRPQTGYFYGDAAADPKRVWAAVAALRYACKGTEHAQAEYAEADRCGRCGRELTDPESIARGVGPECYGQLTGSAHERRIWNAPGQQAPLPLKATPVAC
jgi:hypothetical protein